MRRGPVAQSGLHVLRSIGGLWSKVRARPELPPSLGLDRFSFHRLMLISGAPDESETERPTPPGRAPRSDHTPCKNRARPGEPLNRLASGRTRSGRKTAPPEPVTLQGVTAWLERTQIGRLPAAPVASGAILILLLAAWPARSSPAPKVRLVYTRTAGAGACADGRALQQVLRKRLGMNPFGEPPQLTILAPSAAGTTRVRSRSALNARTRFKRARTVRSPRGATSRISSRSRPLAPAAASSSRLPSSARPADPSLVPANGVSLFAGGGSGAGLPGPVLDDGEAARPAKSPAQARARELALAREQRLLEHARSALSRANYGVALARLEEHADWFAQGELVEEREALWIKVLALTREMQAARLKAQQFKARYPRSVLLPLVEGALAGRRP